MEDPENAVVLLSEIPLRHPNTMNKASEKPQSVVFTLFPKFPIELRAIIWKRAIPAPRVIEFNDTGETRVFGRDPFPGSVPVISVDAKTPAILHVCRESRKVGLQFYKLGFNLELEKPIYFDFDRDIVHVKCDEKGESNYALRFYYLVSGFINLSLIDFHIVRTVILQDWDRGIHTRGIASRLILMWAYQAFRGVQTIYIIDEKANELPSEMTRDNLDQVKADNIHNFAVSQLSWLASVTDRECEMDSALWFQANRPLIIFSTPEEFANQMREQGSDWS